MAAEAFEVSITEAEIADLRERLRRTRWPEREPVDDWSRGLPLAYALEPDLAGSGLSEPFTGRGSAVRDSVLIRRPAAGNVSVGVDISAD